MWGLGKGIENVIKSYLSRRPRFDRNMSFHFTTVGQISQCDKMGIQGIHFNHCGLKVRKRMCTETGMNSRDQGVKKEYLRLKLHILV